MEETQEEDIIEVPVEVPIPSYFERPDKEYEAVRILFNPRKYKYFMKIVYEDTYQAYLNPYDFKTRSRLQFDYDEISKMFVVHKSFSGYSGHTAPIMDSVSLMVDNFTVVDYMWCKEWFPLSLLYDETKTFEQVDDYLTITRKWINDGPN